MSSRMTILERPASKTDSSHRRPNLLFIFSDEHRACSMPGEPFNDAYAPNLAKLVSESVSLRNSISNYPVCTPYRAMLLSGRWPYQTGMLDNGLQLQPEEVSLGRAFERSGYRTGYIGKWHLSPGDGPRALFTPPGPARHGFEHWQTWFHTNQHYDTSFTFDPKTGERMQPKGYNCTLMTDQAIEFIRANREEEWMLILSWNPPHPRFDDAPTEHQQRYDPSTFTFRPNVTETPNLRRDYQGYYAHISALDVELGRLLDTLAATGQAESTIVVYTSDHGDMLGSHGFDGKRLPWDESCKVPFVVRYPNAAPANLKLDGVFSVLDVYPSMCGLAGVPVPNHCVGLDLSAALRGSAAPFPESTFLMHIAKGGATGAEQKPPPLFRGVHTGAHTYAVADDGRWLLYSNREDPYQLRNLIDDPGHKKLARDLDGLVLDWLRRAEDPFPYEAVVRQRSRHV